MNIEIRNEDQTMKNLSEAKRLIKKGTKIKVINHWKTGEKITERKVVKVLTNSFVTAFKENENYFEVNCDWQKAEYMKFNGNKIEFLAHKVPCGNFEYIYPSAFKEGETWLTIIVEE